MTLKAFKKYLGPATKLRRNSLAGDADAALKGFQLAVSMDFLVGSESISEPFRREFWDHLSTLLLNDDPTAVNQYFLESLEHIDSSWTQRQLTASHVSDYITLSADPMARVMTIHLLELLELDTKVNLSSEFRDSTGLKQLRAEYFEVNVRLAHNLDDLNEKKQSYCANCSTKISGPARFCHRCGAAFAGRRDNL